MQFGLKDRLREHNRLNVYLVWLFGRGVRIKIGVTPTLPCDLSPPLSCSFIFALSLITFKNLSSLYLNLVMTGRQEHPGDCQKARVMM